MYICVQVLFNILRQFVDTSISSKLFIQVSLVEFINKHQRSSVQMNVVISKLRRYQKRRYTSHSSYMISLLKSINSVLKLSISSLFSSKIQLITWRTQHSALYLINFDMLLKICQFYLNNTKLLLHASCRFVDCYTMLEVHTKYGHIYFWSESGYG